MRGVIVGILFGACLLTAAVFLLGAQTPLVAFEKSLGAPGPHNPQSRSPGLAMELAFSSDGARVIARQENGDIVAWDVATGAPQPLGRTNGPFAYCPAKDELVSGDDQGLLITSLRQEEQARRIGESPADYAAISADCSVLAAASEDEARIRVWAMSERPRFLTPETKQPVRNGLAISADGLRIAAATGVYDDATGHDAGVEIFALPPWGPASATTAIDHDLIVGMWRIALSDDGAILFTGSQSDAKAGLRAFSSVNGAILWGYDGFKSYWVRGLALSPDGTLLATGDEKGLLRLWDAKSGALRYEGQTRLVIQSLAFSPDGAQLAVGLWDASVGLVQPHALIAGGG